MHSISAQGATIHCNMNKRQKISVPAPLNNTVSELPIELWRLIQSNLRQDAASLGVLKRLCKTISGSLDYPENVLDKGHNHYIPWLRLLKQRFQQRDGFDKGTITISRTPDQSKFYTYLQQYPLWFFPPDTLLILKETTGLVIDSLERKIGHITDTDAILAQYNLIHTPDYSKYERDVTKSPSPTAMTSLCAHCLIKPEIRPLETRNCLNCLNCQKVFSICDLCLCHVVDAEFINADGKFHYIGQTGDSPSDFPVISCDNGYVAIGNIEDEVAGYSEISDYEEENDDPGITTSH